MKKMTNKMKFLMVLTICVGMMVPTMVMAGDISRPVLQETKFDLGQSTVEVKLTSFTTALEFVVQNGDPSGKNRVSSVVITARDDSGSLNETALSPSLFNQEVGSAVGTFKSNALKSPTTVYLDVKVRGPKGGYFKMKVNEKYSWMSGTTAGSWVIR